MDPEIDPVFIKVESIFHVLPIAIALESPGAPAKKPAEIGLPLRPLQLEV